MAEIVVAGFDFWISLIAGSSRKPAPFSRLRDLLSSDFVGGRSSLRLKSGSDRDDANTVQPHNRAECWCYAANRCLGML